VNSRGSRFVRFNSTALVLLATVLLVLGRASAKDHKAKESENQARVVAHISFTGRSVIDMAMQKKGNDKVYLYVQHLQFQGISICRYQQAHCAEGARSNPMAGSSHVEQDERDGRSGDHCRNRCPAGAQPHA